ncbi:prolyl oligopeptidase family serine peptidase [Balneola sp. MJW-20]|uniref:S9 family peptidase n=1 Tax=Gracilimonas aurantiaca TaxID=3234185 RepID=UPI003466524F
MGKRKSLYGLLTTFLFMVFMSSGLAAQDKKTFGIEESMNTVNVNIQALNPDGSYAAFTTATQKNRLNIDHFSFANPAYVQEYTSRLNVLNTGTGEHRDIIGRDAVIREYVWSPDGNTLAFFMLKDQRPTLQLYDVDRNRLRELKPRTDKEIASISDLQWSSDGSALFINLRENGWRDKADSMYTVTNDGPIVIQDSRNDFLAWERVRLHNAMTIPARVEVQSRRVTELAPEGMYEDPVLAEDGSFLSLLQEFPQKTDYTRSGESLYDLYKISLEDPAYVDTLIAKAEEDPDPDWNHAGTAWAYSDDGKIFIRSVDEEEGTEITADFDEKVEDGDTTSISYRFMRWSPDDRQLLLSTDEGYHLIDTAGEEIELVYEFPENRDEAPRLNLAEWTEDGRYLYFAYSARDEWQRGINRYDLESREMEELWVDDHLYGDWQFAEESDVIIFNRASGNRPYEIYVSDDSMDSPAKVTGFNDWLGDYKLGDTELIRYMDVDGDTLYGVLYYPADYEEGKKYPLIALIYETFFDNSFRSDAALLTNRNYFVLRPSVDLEQGYPGEAWMKGVTVAINKLMERGMVDGNKLGVQGTSYGGYAANLLITQTDRFAAAVNNSGKVNMISFLGDSPKITTRNYAAAEVGQDRIGETFWEAPDKYIAHSAVFFADRIKTPLLIMSGEGDWNVPADNQREMYYAMRRLGKTVKWVNYMEGGHGAGRAGRTEDYFHHWETIFDWYAEHFEKKEE